MKAMIKLIPIICLFVITGGSLFYSCSQEKKEDVLSLSKMDGKIVLLDFWCDGCGAC